MLAYSCVTKFDLDTCEFKPFHPLRAVGLAYELGHKLALEKGVLALTWEDLRSVSVSGTFRLKDGARWRAARKHCLQLRPQDARSLVRAIGSANRLQKTLAIQYNACGRCAAVARRPLV